MSIALLVACGCASPTAPTPAARATPPATAAGSSGALPAGPSGALRIAVASMIEFQYPGFAGFYYAPQIQVAETTGNAAVTVTGAQFSIPGHTTWLCGTDQRVEAGEVRELLPELYGDYPLTFDNGGRSSGEVSIVVSFADQAGQSTSLTARVPITPGALPATYTGGRGGSWSCLPVR